MGDWLKKQREENGCFVHPLSPAGRRFDWESLGIPHPESPAAAHFDWSELDLPHPASPVGMSDFGLQTEAPASPAEPEAEDSKGGSVTQNDAEIEGLNLSPTAKAAAYELKKAHPSVKFTSGRRDKQEQAHAMATNVVLNRNWIKQTYKLTPAREACQKWVDDNKDQTTVDQITTGLKGVLDGLSDLDLGRLSKHLSGDAFDVQPVTKDADAIKKTIRGLSGLDKFLEQEGGLERWHAQF